MNTPRLVEVRQHLLRKNDLQARTGDGMTAWLRFVVARADESGEHAFS
ncbi:MAG TPA: hypothetical protein VMO26_28450 [Vicinamibacterales bacterium]|nr:hypothetical protein [Vicinamibacterales bacterium]